MDEVTLLLLPNIMLKVQPRISRSQYHSVAVSNEASKYLPRYRAKACRQWISWRFGHGLMYLQSFDRRRSVEILFFSCQNCQILWSSGFDRRLGVGNAVPQTGTLQMSILTYPCIRCRGTARLLADNKRANPSSRTITAPKAKVTLTLVEYPSPVISRLLWYVS
jgi:hypothetical protein